MRLVSTITIWIGKSRLQPRLLGLGLLWAWVYCCWFSSPTFPEDIDAGKKIDSLFFFVSFCVVLFVSWALRYHGKPIHAYVQSQVCAAAFMFVGTIFHSIPYDTLTGIILAKHFTAVCAGTGCAWIWLEWGNLYGKLKADSIGPIVTLSAIAVPLCVLIQYGLHSTADVFFVAALPLASCAALRLSFASDSHSERRESVAKIAPRQFWSIFTRVGVGTLIVYLTNSICLNLIPLQLETYPGEWFGVSVILGSLIGVVAAMLLLSLSNNTFDIYSAYRYFLPFIAIACCALTFNHKFAWIVSSTSLFAVQIAYSIILCIFLAHVVKIYSFGFGIGWGFCHAGMALGIPCGIFIAALVEAGIITIGNACGVMMVVCIVAIILPMNKANALYTTGNKPESTIPSPASPINDCKEPPPPPPSFIPPDAIQTDIESLCTAICKRSKLTNRESEIFMLLARGATLAQIRNLLFISQNTANTHVKSIYKKLGIHSRHELINLVYVDGRDTESNSKQDDCETPQS